MLTDYLDWLADAGRSPHTIIAYKRDLTSLTPTPVGIRRYADALARAPYKPASLARKTAAARSYCRWLEERGVQLGDWARILAYQSPETDGPPPPLGADHLERLLAAPRGRAPAALRDRAILRVLADTGARVSELVDLDVGHVLPDRTIVLGAGTERERHVPIDSDTAEAISRYASLGRPALAGERPSTALFVNHRGERFTRQGIWLRLRWACETAKIPPVHPAQLRHTAAARLANFATNLDDAQYLLGHRSPYTTRAYRRAA